MQNRLLTKIFILGNLKSSSRYVGALVSNSVIPNPDISSRIFFLSKAKPRVFDFSSLKIDIRVFASLS